MGRATWGTEQGDSLRERALCSSVRQPRGEGRLQAWGAAPGLLAGGPGGPGLVSRPRGGRRGAGCWATQCGRGKEGMRLRRVWRSGAQGAVGFLGAQRAPSRDGGPFSLRPAHTGAFLRVRLRGRGPRTPSGNANSIRSWQRAASCRGRCAACARVPAAGAGPGPGGGVWGGRAGDSGLSRPRVAHGEPVRGARANARVRLQERRLRRL